MPCGWSERNVGNSASERPLHYIITEENSMIDVLPMPNGRGFCFNGKASEQVLLPST